MPNDGSLHLFTDNSGSEFGPTTIYSRSVDAQPSPLRLEGMVIPADVHISPDGSTLYFVDYGHNPSRIFKSEKGADGWLKPAPVKELDMPKGSGYLTSTSHGVVYFYSDGDIYHFANNQIDKLPEQINTSAREHDPFIAQDESFLIVVREDGEGDSNMYISFNLQGGWSPTVKLPAPFNDKKIDGSPYVTPDKQYLFFSSNRGSDVLQTWQAPFLEYYTAQRKSVAGNKKAAG